MVMSFNIICKKCGHKKRVSASGDIPLICNECATESATKQKYDYLESLTRLSTPDRLEKIEEYIYDKQHEVKFNDILG